MTNNILDVLTYMFDYLFEEAKQGASKEIDDTTLKARLSEAGFDLSGINKALTWLENIATTQDDPQDQPLQSSKGSIRIYSAEEKLKLNAKARGFILFMENIGQLTSSQRELAIEQIMSLDDSDLSLDDLKWVVMMVLGNSRSDKTEAQWLESIVFQEKSSGTLQ